MSSYYGGWGPYVPVAERRRQAAREMQKLRKAGHPVTPVIVEGRTIAGTFWGKAWCDNLESYRDFDNRLARGRTYVRNGSVVDLQITPLKVTARVAGSSVYEVAVTIAALPKARWQSICRDCAGSIDSLVELLQGRFSQAVMERLCRQDKGLFPRPSDIRFSCDCPDGASMCKHVAATLYGVGVRLDEKPELLFRLRSVDQNDLLADLDAATPTPPVAPAGKLLQVDDMAALFGIEMAVVDAPKTAGSPAPKTKPAASRATGGAASAAPAVVAARPRPARRPGKTAEPVQPHPTAPEAPASRPKKPVGRPAAPKAAPQLTADGFVKWWR